jgi:hypothetical protein
MTFSQFRKTKPISKAKKMLLSLTINGRRRSYFAARTAVIEPPAPSCPRFCFRRNHGGWGSILCSKLFEVTATAVRSLYGISSSGTR